MTQKDKRFRCVCVCGCVFSAEFVRAGVKWGSMFVVGGSMSVCVWVGV